MPGLTGPNAAARRHRRRRTARYVSLAVAIATAAALLVPLALADHHGISQADAGSPAPTVSVTTSTAPGVTAPAPALPRATLTIAPNADTVPVPSSFFGISTEYRSLTLRQFASNMPVFERVLAMLHVQGDGPLVLRIGGDSADTTFWRPRWQPMPQWAFELTPRYLSRLAGLVRRDRVRLIVDLNLVTGDTPITAAAWARAAETLLPRHSIVGFEVGNEPDLYSRRYWVATLARSPLLADTLPFELTPSTYVQDFADYASVIGEHAPDIPLIGPAVAHPRDGLSYITALIEDQRPELGAVSGHLYPYSACVKRPRAADYPTVARVLSRRASTDFATDIAPAVAAAHAAGLKFRLTEFNSVTCGGKPGVSDTFATALWAPDALFTALRAGADGANLHVRDTAINSPFTIDRGGLTARPLLYGLLMFTRTLGPQARLVRLHLSAARSLNLSAWAVKVRGDILHVLLIDKGSRAVRVALRLPTSARASVQRLLAPSAYARSGVTLAGRQLNYKGSWTGPPRIETITAGPRGYLLTLSRRSAALMSVRLAAPGPRGRAASEHHRRVAVTQHAVLAVRLHRSSKH
ncbi:MAG: hypothetical protein JO046_17985 [Solirubrobacterales bacterium]|nr:hypothetical protein [Solirubrobacterales bacterium]